MCEIIKGEEAKRVKGEVTMLIGCDDAVECALSRYYDSIDREIEEEEEENWIRRIKMESLELKLFNIKENALKELRKAQDSIKEAYEYIAEYNSEIDFNCAEELIDRNFLDEFSRKMQEVELYSQWATEERVALENEGYKAILDRRAA